MRETKSQRQERTEQIIKLLKRAHPDAHCALNHSNAFELLVATILSAQCTDERVNIVTADLFRKYRKPADYLKVPATELQQDVRTTGFFRNKTKSIQGEIEQDLMKLVPRKDWIIFSHLLIFHGRRVCKARRPLCEECVVEKLCPSSLLKQPNR